MYKGSNSYHRGPYKPKAPQHKINEMIRAHEVRVTGTHPATGEKFPGEVMDTREAQRLAHSLDTDLVMVSETADPPVVRICDYKKFLYEQKRRKKDQEQSSKRVEVKELRLGPTTDEHDLEFKSKHAINWLQNGDKVRAVVVFKGRMITHKEHGELVLAKLAQKLEEYGLPENLPTMEGKRMYMSFKPKPKK